MIQSVRPNRFQRAFLRAYGWGTIRLYNELAWAYDPISRFVSAGRWDTWRRMALDYVAGPCVLEVGFGTGELLLALRAAGLNVVGVDTSVAMHRVVRRKLRGRGVTIPRLRASAGRLPFAAAAFDTIVSTFPAGYILEPETLAELGRVLRPAGRLVIAGLSVQLPRSVRYPLSIVPGSWDRLWAYFERVAKEAGLAVTVTWRDDGPARVPVVIAVPDSGAVR